jgi:hypothetical protein
METKGNQMLTIYGCRKSKSGNYLNVTLVRNEGERKTYYTACVKLDNSGKVKTKEGKTKEGHEVYLLSIPVLTPKKTEAKADTAKDDTKDLPF